MSIRIMNPVARPQAETARPPVRIERVRGQRFGLLFNGHVSAVNFWRHFERHLSKLYQPLAVISVRKENTFAPAADESELTNLEGKSDLLLTGVGA
ncbi:MAG: hypothetical protein ACE5JU_20310 [Candidatus Binatia bacterium]